jgi:protease-4
MNQFFKFLFASCLGTALALLLLMFIGFGMLASLAGSATEKKAVTVKPNSVLELDFRDPLPDKTNNVELDPFQLDPDDVVGAQDMVATIRRAKEDDDIKGIYLNASFVQAGKASSALVRQALLDFKTSGKFIVSYADLYTQNAYYIASVADSILLNPVGAVDVRGYSSLISFYKGLLEKLDVQMRIFYAGKFKSATEPFRLEKMSDENRLQVREYLGALYDVFVRDVAASRNLSEADVRRLADEFAGRSPALALQGRLIDRIAYEDEAFSLMKAKIGLGEDDKLTRIKIQDYYRARGKKSDYSVRDKIAVVYAEGTISDGEKGQPGSVVDGEFVKILRKIRQDDQVKAVVLRINSPGGSVLASENIYREVQLVKKAGKPVVVSMGDVAASGGYYIAAPADSIFAEATTITGSIGVFGMIPILENTMRNKLGITYDTVRTGRYSAFGTPFIDFSPEESALIQERIEHVYDDFLGKVASGRRKSKEEIHAIAQGRVWAGTKAREIGLVDEIGGLDRALASAAKLAGIEKYRTTEYPRPRNNFEQLLNRFTNKDEDEDDSVRAWMLRSELGEFYPVYQVLRDFKKNKGLQARLPYELIIN